MWDRKLKVYLARDTLNGGVDIKIKKTDDPNTTGWFIGTITKKGTLRLLPCLALDLGLQTDNDGRIIVEKL